MDGPPALRGPSSDTLSSGSSGADYEAKKKEQLQFRLSHALLLAFFILIIFVQGLGVYLFTNGFLLSRLVLDHKSDCSVPPPTSHSQQPPDTSDGCWHPRSFKKAVVLIIDALRYDFTIPSSGTPRHYQDAIPLLHDTAALHPQNAVLRPFIADPPTTTLQRLKGLTTGTLPTFIEAGSNFAGNAIEEDNLIAQFKHNGRNIVHLGDDTWQALFPGHFDSDLTRPFDSFNVKDIHTVDDGVITHLIPLLHPSNASKWDILIGHFLGVDHVGHNRGPDDPIMHAKLGQMNQVLTKTMDLVDEDTLLVVMGDHGMDSKGNHGGESDDEVEAALWLYSKRPFFGRSSPGHALPPQTAKERPVAQIDLVPTLALLLGVPVPYNSLGAPIEEAFLGPEGNNWQTLAHAEYLATAQIRRFQGEYAKVRTPDAAAAALPSTLWDAALDDWDRQLKSNSSISKEQWRNLAASSRSYQRQTLAMFRALWARFDVPNMVMGVAILFFTIVVMTTYAKGVDGTVTDLHRSLCVTGASTLILGGALGYVIGTIIPEVTPAHMSAFLGALTCCIALLVTMLRKSTKLVAPIPLDLRGWICSVAVILLGGGFGSNSYTVWEEEILLYLLGLFGTLLLVQAARVVDNGVRLAASINAFLFMAMIRIGAISRICREEQMPNCSPLFYASTSSTTSAGWRIALPFVLAVALPSVVRIYYDQTLSYQASAPFWISVAFRTSLFLVASFWALQTISGSWMGLNQDTIELIRTYIAQLVLAIAVGAGGATYAWQPPLIGVETVTVADDAREQRPTDQKPEGSTPLNGGRGGRAQLLIRGTTNLYGSHFAMLPFTILLIPLLLLSKPMGQLSLVCVTIAILSLLELLFLLSPRNSGMASHRSPSSSPVGPTILALLGHFAYFKTGHQAALASIQWDMAFAASKTLRYPWSPIFVTLNTFAGQILCAAAVPAVVLWRRPFNLDSQSSSSQDSAQPLEKLAPAEGADRRKRRDALLSDLAKAQMTHFLVYSVINLATTVFAAHLRRHLMLYRVFCPRWMLSGVGMIVAELAGCLIGLAGTSWTVGGISDVFGW